MSEKRNVCQALMSLGLVGWLSCTAGAAPWDKLISSRRVEADPKKSYDLRDSNGPWMILACSFSGPKAEQQARELVLELRRRYKLPAYQYEKKFDLGEEVYGLGVDKYGNPKRMKYARGKAEVEEIAVLVGDYPSADDPEGQATLKKLKYYQPECLKMGNGKETARSLAGWRAIQAAVLSSDSEKRKKGPMGHAFVTTNPLLPPEYYVPQGLDEIVLKANEGVEYCLLECPAKYTVMVAHFTGRSRIILHQKDAEQGLSLMKKTKADDSPLVKATENAHRLTVALRRRGVEAYEFHDRNASIVTVGSFNSYGTPRPDGVTELDPRIVKIMETYKGRPAEYPGGLATPQRLQELPDVPFDVQPIIVQAPKRPINAPLRRQTASRN
jgi:hypothetical protein